MTSLGWSGDDFAVSMSEDGHWLASASHDDAGVSLWDLRKLQHVVTVTPFAL
jgi:WD40 repeat protein